MDGAPISFRRSYSKSRLQCFRSNDMLMTSTMIAAGKIALVNIVPRPSPSHSTGIHNVNSRVQTGSMSKPLPAWYRISNGSSYCASLRTRGSV